MRLRDGDIARIREAVVPARGPQPEPETWLERQMHRRLLVHTSADQSIEGTLVVVAEDGVVLCSAIAQGRNPVKLGGEVFIPRDQVVLVQTVRGSDLIAASHDDRATGRETDANPARGPVALKPVGHLTADERNVG